MYYVCGKCDKGVDIIDNYCRHCGVKIGKELKVKDER
jgi:DNA-directed RNA polymerase subunit RPC12/RpoP